MRKNCAANTVCPEQGDAPSGVLAAKRVMGPRGLNDGPMKALLVKTILFGTIPLVSLAVFYCYNREFLPAYRVTNSYSFNEKIGWLPEPVKTDVITVGSSMSQNNISSEVLTTGLGTTRYLNVSAWGTKIGDIESLLPVFVKLYHPSIVVCASNVMDFWTSSIKYDDEAVEKELTRKTRVNILHLLDRYYLVRTVDNRTNRRSNTVYSSLCFDDWGGVPLADHGFDVEPSRWEKRLRCDRIDDRNYEALSEVSRYLKAHGIYFIFVHTPLRASLHNPVDLSGVSQHMAKVRGLLEHDGHLVVDLSHTICPDGFFVDSVHLNKRGADSITQMVIAAHKSKLGY